MLEVKGISAGYGDLNVLHDVSIKVSEGEFVGIVGANAAGKTTLVRCITGLIPVRSGEIEWFDEPLNDVAAHQRPERGIVLVPEGRALFGYMTVLENLEIGATNGRARSGVSESLEQVFSLFPDLKTKQKALARSLSGGQQQMLAVARALMAQPRLLILDEPSIGLAPKVVGELYALLRSIYEQGTAILLIEQDVRRCLSCVGRGYVLANGSVVTEGSAKDLLLTDDVRKAYLGL